MKKNILAPAFFAICLQLFAGAGSENLKLEDKITDKNIDKSFQDLGPNEEIAIKNNIGNITLIGWDKNEVQVAGTLGKYLTDFKAEREGRKIIIETTLPEGKVSSEDFDAMSSDLIIKAPQDSVLRIRSLSGVIKLLDFHGKAYCETMSGNIIFSDIIEDYLDKSNADLGLPDKREYQEDVFYLSGDSFSISDFEEMKEDMDLTLSIDGENAYFQTTTKRLDFEEGDIVLSSLSGSIIFDWQNTQVPDIRLANQLGNTSITLSRDVQAKFIIETVDIDSIDIKNFTTTYPKDLRQIGNLGGIRIYNSDNGRGIISLLEPSRLTFQTGDGKSTIFVSTKLLGGISFKIR